VEQTGVRLLDVQKDHVQRFVHWVAFLGILIILIIESESLRWSAMNSVGNSKGTCQSSLHSGDTLTITGLQPLLC